MVGTHHPAAVDHQRARAALGKEVGRVVGLLRSGIDPSAPALGGWSVADVAMHLSQAWVAVPGLAREDVSEVWELLPEREGTAGRSLIPSIGDLANLTTSAASADPERDLGVLADRIQERAARYLRTLDEPGKPSSSARPWLVDGVEVSTTTLTCHLLNETVVHGWDIARPSGVDWPVDPASAAMVIDGFVIPVFQALGPREMVDQEAAAGLRANFDVKVRGGGRYRFAFDDGALSVTGAGAGAVAGRVDCHISAEPSAFLLVAWGRRSQWPAIAAGRITAWGRKPWLGLRFRSLVRNP